MAEEERILEVTPDFDGKRIDQCLAASFSDCSRSFLQKLLKDGKVSINGKTQKASSKVAAGDAVLVLLPEPEKLNVEPENIPLDILYEDDDLLVVNKPKGMVVHPAAGHSNGTLVNAVLYHCRGNLSGINCGAEVAQQSFMATKNLYSKASGTFFYHYVQSFSPQENVTPAQAHQIALELAERFFPGCEVLVATHVDAEHPHSHFVVNSVHPDTGKKLHFTPRTLEQMRAVSDQLCLEHGLSTLKPYQQNRRTKGLRTGEYRAAVRGESWKFQLITTVEAVMERAGSREEFIREMERLPGALGGRPEVYHLHHPHRDEVPG